MWKRILTSILSVCIIGMAAVGCGNQRVEDTSSISSIPSSSSSESSSSSPIVVPSPDDSETATTPNSSESINSSAPRETVSVTIPEGWTFMQIANELEQSGVCTAQEFYQTAQNYNVQSFSVPSDPNRCFKMEGYLFPDTYTFYKNDDPTNVLIKMLNNYAAKSGMPSETELILASIIEKETRSDEHMKLVSSVFHNRLNQGMRLDSDPTREYVNDFITGNNLIPNQSKYAALYNTYKCQIPAGPICNPGARAIEAAKSPASTNYLYFFFGNDNTNHYSTTLEEHQQLMQQYGVQYGVATQ